jgi:hypothetical protein
VECELLRQTELVDEGGHDIRVVFCRALADHVGNVSRKVLPRGMNLFLPLGTSGDVSDAMVMVCRDGVAGKES